ncbi:MAG: pantoate--beta-alanine ligase, partial [Candidatus Omnitrophota bacterium]
MKIISGINQMQRYSNAVRLSKKKIGFVPTMGCLHEGHLSLIRRARGENGCVVVSIYVNPKQFGPKEDFKKYPRSFSRDIAMCKKEGVDVIFAPRDIQMYPKNYFTYVEVEKLTRGLCGKSRPGHFKG